VWIRLEVQEMLFRNPHTVRLGNCHTMKTKKSGQKGIARTQKKHLSLCPVNRTNRKSLNNEPDPYQKRVFFAGADFEHGWLRSGNGFRRITS
jgi:hypothetical protein